MSSVSGIYVILNKRSSKIYIGSSHNIPHRWKEHKRELNSGKHKNRYLQSAWNKHGAKSFEFKVLEYCSVEQMKSREQHFIDIYKPKGLCYNIAGDVEYPMRGLKHSESTRQKMRDAIKRRPPISEETRRKQSEAAKHRPPVSEETRQKLSEAARNITEETRRKISEAGKGRVFSDEARRKLSDAAKLREQRKRSQQSNED